MKGKGTNSCMMFPFFLSFSRILPLEINHFYAILIQITTSYNTSEKIMSVISSENVNEIIRKTLSIINKSIISHGEITGYILYKMLEYDRIYSEQELVDYTMLGILHDIGFYREPNVNNFRDIELKDPWTHSVYGFLFLKYLSPMDDKAEIILYHHLDYNRYSKVKSRYLHIIEYLNLADKMDTFMHMGTKELDKDYFTKYRDITFSGRALDTFLKAEEKYQITNRMADGSFKDELSSLLTKKVFAENYKKGFLEMLAYTIDFRSEHTVIHTMATVSFAIQLGKLMRLKPSELNHLYYGALLHDIGKIAIPIEILESTDRLSQEDMRVMKAHVRITEMILEGTIDEEVVKIASRHHEKIDGSGYHKGLTEKDLTLPQKIVAVADILSALYGKRSYKESFESSKIKEILSEEAGNNKISKEVVACLFRNFDTIINRFEKEKKNILGLYFRIKEEFGIIMKEFEKLE